MDDRTQKWIELAMEHAIEIKRLREVISNLIHAIEHVLAGADAEIIVRAIIAYERSGKKSFHWDEVAKEESE